MRFLTLVLTIGVLVLGAHVLARGQDEPADSEVAQLKKKVLKLELQVQYLLQRETALTQAVLVDGTRGADIERMVRTMRQQGYENRSIPAESRQTLTAGLEALAKSLQTDLPAVTEEQAGILKKAQLVR